mmetsp:Transcript_33389/g.71938  ORF Transcript_33389/g.71938 Transcript_33389/m.71938 type:complete len:574 (-) Transcript_33389:502-2223(-)
MILVAGATDLLVTAAPTLLVSGPAGFPVGQALLAVVGMAHRDGTTRHRLPGPVAADHHLVPDLSGACVAGRWRVRRLAALLLVVAAPDLLGRGPCPTEVAQRRMAIERLKALALLATASGLNGACAAHIAFHLHLAVGQVAGVFFLRSEDVFLSPLHALRARARLALDDALGIAAQGRQRGVGAAQLERLAAEIPLIAGPAGHVAVCSVAVELHTVLRVALVAAPVLLVGRPTLDPVVGASLAVVASMSHTVLLHVNLDVMLPVAMEIAWAAPGLVSAAPLLLGAGPSVEPVLEARVAVIGLHHMDHLLPMAAAHVLMVAAPALLGVRPKVTPILQAVVAVVGLIDHSVPLGVILGHHMWWRRHGHLHEVVRALHVHRVGFLHIDHLRRLMEWHRHAIMDHHRLHHSGARHVHVHVVRWTWHVIGAVDGAHDGRMRRHWLGHRHTNPCHLRHGVVVVLVHDCVWAPLFVFVAAPAHVPVGPIWIWLATNVAGTVVGPRGRHHVHCVDQRWLRRHLDLHIMVLRNGMIHRVVVASHHVMHLRWLRSAALESQSRDSFGALCTAETLFKLTKVDQ